MYTKNIFCSLVSAVITVSLILSVVSIEMSAAKPLDIYDEIMEEDKLFLRMAELIESIGSNMDEDDFRQQPYGPQPVKTSPERCSLPVRKGVCRALIPRWSYDPVTKECNEFKFGGCDGNGNNFSSKRQCIDLCRSTESARV